MSNLSPQGYNITMDPINNNPFWEGDTPTPVQTYNISTAPTRGVGPIKLGNLPKDEYTFVTAASWMGYPITRESLLTDWYIYQDKRFRVNARLSMSEAELKAVFAYYSMLYNVVTVNECILSECLELYMIGLVDGTTQNLIVSRFGELGQQILNAFTNTELPENYNGYKLILINDDDVQDPIFLNGYCVYIDEITPSIFYTAEGRTAITEDS